MNEISVYLIMFNLIQSMVYNKNNVFFLYKSLEFFNSIFYFIHLLEGIEISIIWLKILQLKKLNILFVGTTSDINLFVKKQAIRCNCFYINRPWIAGTLTNWHVMNKFIRRNYIKYSEGFIRMHKLPDLVIIINPDYEIDAVRECHKLKIPTLTIKNKKYFDPNLMLPGSNGIDFIEILLPIISNTILDIKNK